MLERTRQKYNSKVLVNGWEYNREALPYDNPNPKMSESHYKTLSASTESCIPRSTSIEAMEMVEHNPPHLKAIRRSKTNFTTFTILSSISDSTNKNEINRNDDLTRMMMMMSTYNRDYNVVSHYKRKKPPCCNMDLPHPLLNRRPKSEFIIAGPAAPGKFMDSHFFEIPKNRKCINHLRQIRNTSSIFQY